MPLAPVNSCELHNYYLVLSFLLIYSSSGLSTDVFFLINTNINNSPSCRNRLVKKQSCLLTTRRLWELSLIWKGVSCRCFVWSIAVKVCCHTCVFIHIFGCYAFIVNINILLCVHPVRFCRWISIGLAGKYFGLTNFGFEMRSCRYVGSSVVY